MKAVVFDVDGTLVDSEREGHRVAFDAAFAWAGMPDRWDPETYGELLSVTGGRRRLETWLVHRGRDPEAARRLATMLHARKTQVFREMVVDGRVPARPGAVGLVRSLAAHQIDLYVATTGTRVWVEPLLDHHFGRGTFAGVHTGSEVADLKPDPAVYLAVLAEAGLDAADAVAVEDSANGLRAARAAGLPCVVVTHDYTRDQDFSGAELVTTGFDDRALWDWFRSRLPAATPQ